MSRIDDAIRRAERGGAQVVEDQPGAQPGAFEQYAEEGTRHPVDEIRPMVDQGRRQIPQAAAVQPPPPWTVAVRGESSIEPPADLPKDRRLVTTPQVHSSVRRQYRHLAAMLHETQLARGIRTVLVASAVPREGKSLTVANLALTLSGSYRRRVLVVDADLHRPAQHELFRISNTHGLSDGLRSGRECLAPISVTPDLAVLPAGVPDPSPLTSLTSERLQQVITEAAHQYDWVIVDTPPVSVLPDAKHLSRLVDGVLFVVGASQTPSATIESALTEIGREKVLGTILNRAKGTAIDATGDDYRSEY